MNYHGNPCWYELGTGDLDAAAGFYGRILGWQVVDSGMEGFDYRLARSDGDMVAGLMSISDQQGDPSPNWLIYFAADDCDKTAADVRALIALARETVLRELGYELEPEIGMIGEF